MNKYLINITLISVFILNTPHLFSQCYPDRHNTSWFNGWASCETSQNPNPERGDGHWILYNLKEVFQLGNIHLWNTNDPKHLEWGMKEYFIDVSNDGQNWIEAGKYELNSAPGFPEYEGEPGPDLTGHEGQFILITIVSNYGGDCFGFGEIRIEAEETTVISSIHQSSINECYRIQAYPNPFVNDLSLQIKADCSGDLSYTILDVLGKIVISGEVFVNEGQNQVHLKMEDFPAGTYYLKTRMGSNHSLTAVSKINRT